MIRPNAAVIESNVPAAEPRERFTTPATLKQRREQEDITAWLEMQEDAELELLTHEIANKGHRRARFNDRAYY